MAHAAGRHSSQRGPRRCATWASALLLALAGNACRSDPYDPTMAQSVSPAEGAVLLSGGNALHIPAGAVQGETRVRMRTLDDGRVELSPEVMFSQPAWLFFGADLPSIKRLDIPGAAAVPTTHTPAGTLAMIAGFSTWGRADPPVPCGSVPDCFLETLTLSTPADCPEVLASAVQAWLVESHVPFVRFGGGYIVEGIAVPICVYPQELDSQFTLTKDEVSGLWRMFVPVHRPKLQTHIYMASRASFEGLLSCSAADAARLYSQLLDHELGHARINAAAELAWTGTVPIAEVPEGTPEQAIKQVGYKKGCWQWYATAIGPLQASYHASAPNIEAGVSAECIHCGDRCSSDSDCNADECRKCTVDAVTGKKDCLVACGAEQTCCQRTCAAACDECTSDQDCDSSKCEKCGPDLETGAAVCIATCGSDETCCSGGCARACDECQNDADCDVSACERCGLDLETGATVCLSNCRHPDACFEDFTCDPSTGKCIELALPKPNGSACDDGDSCTSADGCQNGRCVGTRIACCGAAACCNGVPLAPGNQCCADGKQGPSCCGSTALKPGESCCGDPSARSSWPLVACAPGEACLVCQPSDPINHCVAPGSTCCFFAAIPPGAECCGLDSQIGAVSYCLEGRCVEDGCER